MVLVVDGNMGTAYPVRPDFQSNGGSRKLMTPGIKNYSRGIFQGQLRAGVEAKRCFLP